SGLPADAEPELARALELAPADAEASRLLALAQRELGRPDDAIATLTRAAAARPDDWTLQRNLGMQLNQLGRLEDALVACERMVALTPGNARGKSTLGAIHYYLAQNSEAIDAYLESIAIEPNYRAFSNIATIYMAERRFADAATNLEAALRLDDGDYRVWANLAATYERLPGRETDLAAANTRSMELARGRLREAGDDAAAWSLLGLGHAIAGEGAEARRTVGKALALAPGDMDVLFHAASVEERLGNRTKALELARRALRAGIPVGMMEAEPAWRDLVASSEFLRIVSEVRGKTPEGA
ncbi:tetratricopeptide repeat protein, partial [bacterium]|nr:tetratricopeptide repeat protein [bacterium]